MRVSPLRNRILIEGRNRTPVTEGFRGVFQFGLSPLVQEACPQAKCPPVVLKRVARFSPRTDAAGSIKDQCRAPCREARFYMECPLSEVLL